MSPGTHWREEEPRLVQLPPTAPSRTNLFRIRRAGIGDAGERAWSVACCRPGFGGVIGPGRIDAQNFNSHGQGGG